MRKRTSFTDDRLRAVKQMAMDVWDACDDIINGDTVLQAANKHGMDMLRFRRVVYAMESSKGACKGVRNLSITNDCVLTPVERFYTAVFGCGPDDVYDCMPIDPEDSIRMATSYLTPKEQVVIRRRYCVDVSDDSINQRNELPDDGSQASLDAIGKDLGVTKERIRMLESRAIKKMRQPHRLNILRIGVRATNEIQQRAEELHCEMVELEARKLAEEIARREALERTRTNEEKTLITTLDLSPRSIKCLSIAGVHTLRDLLDLNEHAFSNLPNFGRKSQNEVITWLESNGYDNSILATKYRQRH